MVTAPWAANYPRERFAHIVYAVKSAADLNRALDAAGKTRGDRFSLQTADCRTPIKACRPTRPGGCGDSSTRPDCGIAGKAKTARRFQGSTR